MKNLYCFVIALSAVLFLPDSVCAQSRVINRFAGTGASGFSGDGGSAITATLDSPGAIVTDRFGNIYISADSRLRKVNTAGIISTIAGTGVNGYSGDGGPATSAQFSDICAIAIDTFGNIFVADRYNNRVRKITMSGIVTTVAGNGSMGVSGDGGLATAASLGRPGGLALDLTGNIYIAQSEDNKIRKVGPTGIITTYGGTGGSGFSGDGGMATSATLSFPAGLAVDGSGNLFISDESNGRIRKINSSGIISTVAGGGPSTALADGLPATSAFISGPPNINFDDSGNLYINCRGTIRMVDKTNGKISTVAGRIGVYSSGIGGFAAIANLNARGFTFDMYGNLVYSSNNAVLAIGSSTANTLYLDANNNCIFDSGDSYLVQPAVVEIDSSGVPIDTLSASSVVRYYMKGPIGTVYQYKVLSMPPGLALSCPLSGIIADTVNANDNFMGGEIGFACSGAPGFDMEIGAVSSATGVHSHVDVLYIKNNSCNPVTSPTLTLYHSPKYTLSSGTPSYTASVGNKIEWDITSFSYSMSEWQKVVYQGDVFPMLTIGDTAHFYYDITPHTGDWNPANNLRILVDTVRAGFDPNLIEVNPSRCITSGTTLEYTIHFENTGNDTAHNIFVIDSLSDYLDPQSFRLEFASNQMATTRIYSGGHAIMKFDFPNINLLDSSHHGLCDGMFKYTIRTKPSLPPATSIINRAGIYFDYNDVVNTNTVENIIDCPLSVSGVPMPQSVQLYPNPAADELTIKTTVAYSSFTISNSIGQAVMQQSLQGAQTTVNVKVLPPGLYLVLLQGEGGREVVKFVKK